MAKSGGGGKGKPGGKKPITSQRTRVRGFEARVAPF